MTHAYLLDADNYFFPMMLCCKLLNCTVQTLEKPYRKYSDGLENPLDFKYKFPES